jgi:hypothetical protein
MGAVVQLAQVRQRQEEERWRAVGYRAIDDMEKKLTVESEGKNFEELSDPLRREGQAVTGTLLAEVLRSRGVRERSAITHVCEDCGRTLPRQRQLHRRTLESLHGELAIERPYFYCRHCQRGFHPFESLRCYIQPVSPVRRRACTWRRSWECAFKSNPGF